MDDYDAGVTRQLDAIRAGGRNVVLQTRQKIATALDRLDEGDFVSAHERLFAASVLVSNLATAQAQLAIADGTRLLPALELEVGMEIVHCGVVVELDREPCSAARCPGNVLVKFRDEPDDKPMHIHGHHEVYVVDHVPDE